MEEVPLKLITCHLTLVFVVVVVVAVAVAAFALGPFVVNYELAIIAFCRFYL